MQCRFCKSDLEHVFIDLFNAPASNSFLVSSQLNEPESYYPLKVYTCSNCFLVQVDEYKKSDAIFDSSYVYFSSYSKTWLEHAKQYADLMTNRFALNSESRVLEIASNDGYLLQYFKQKKIPVLGIEPTTNTAEVARAKGIETITEFFGVKLARDVVAKGVQASLLVGNNVLAHVPDIVDFVAGMKVVLESKGVITMEFPHLMQLIDNNQFDTIYHEHFSYLSFQTVSRIFIAQGLKIFDVEELTTHGGSLRIYACHSENNQQETSSNVGRLLKMEFEKGLLTLAYYEGFQKRALKLKMGLLTVLIQLRQNNKKVAAYGAAAKGNTLLNYCGIRTDLIDFVVDANPHKQNKFLPGSHIPVVDETVLRVEQPDYILILPWNLKNEIMLQLDYVKEWGARFVIPVPDLQII